LEMAIEYTVSEWITIETEWKFSVPSKIFSSYVGLLNDDNVSIELLQDDSLHLQSDSGSIKIKWLDASEFPLVPPIQEEISFSLTGNVLKKSIIKTLFSAAEGNIRPTLAGIYLQVAGKQISFASTDSLRLSEYILDNEKDFWVEFSQIIPAKTCSEVSRIVEDKAEIKLVSWDNQVAFYTENIKIYSRLLNWAFPDYKEFFPDSFQSKAIVNKDDLVSVLRKINLISRENNFSIKMSFSVENGLLLETSETQIGEWSLPLVASVEWPDDIIWVNSTFLLEALSVIETSHVSMSFLSAQKPILIVPISEDQKKIRGDYKHIIMPLSVYY
jgi:DNA polymerase-3 subunit beta